ncbi:MAG TPA: long-chain N-acyl amino acid synthase [Nitrosomonas europaea]|uniref:N-acyl amino acid synthase FeeM domain-containing protein n=1 Tax=Nitrosomonas europaea TaxID=915 RepID=UPI002492C013|nr:long-chain N-acyl amino acid synthase [Nitrosomonas europaea]HRO57443.1 long-chain N-acyl amino acid synthase [Nitrosomonas europaea]
MQIANHLQSGTAVKNIQPAHIPFSPHQPDSTSSDDTDPRFPRSQKYRISRHPGSNSSHIAETDCLLQRNGYSIHLVNSLKQRIKASTLIKRMYASRGYQTESASVFSTSSNQYTFEARQSQQLIGTLTLTIDTGKGLLADTLYQPELDQFRRQGRRLCEVSKLAFNPETSSKEIFASLFHMAYIFACHIHNTDDSFIEINPRHATFYKRMLGFRQVGELRTCPRVNAPAVLLHLDLGYMKEQITTQAGQFNQKTKSIYPHFLSQNREKEIIRIIQARQTSFTLFSIQKTDPGHYSEYLQLT